MEEKKIEPAKQEIQKDQEEKGATFVEYILLVSLIAIAVIAVLSLFGQRVSVRFSQLGSAI